MIEATDKSKQDMLDNYSSSILSLKHKGLADLPDGGTCIRLAPDILNSRKKLLMYLEFLDVWDREKARGMMR